MVTQKPIKKPTTKAKNTNKSTKNIARKANTNRSTYFRDKYSDSPERLSTHCYELVDCIKIKKINNDRDEMQFKLRNVDTDNIINKKGIFSREDDDYVYMLTSPLEGFPHVAMSVFTQYNTPCDIVRQGEHFVLIPIDPKAITELDKKMRLHLPHIYK